MPLTMLRSPSFAPHRTSHPDRPRDSSSSSRIWVPSPSPSSPSSKKMLRPSLLLNACIVAVFVLASALINQGRSNGPAHSGTTANGAGSPMESHLAHEYGHEAVSATCASLDQPNLLAEQFPNNATGMLNATLAIIPIPLESARRLIPARYGILERAYRDLLPDFPAGMYPMMVQAAHDHDVQFRAFGLTIDDFSRVGYEFPFLDLLGDGYSSFRWAPAQLITANHHIALEGSRAYGTKVSPATWDPPCDAYRRVPGKDARTVSFRGSSAATGDFFELEMTRLTGMPFHQVFNPYPLALFMNITNQPTFANASACDSMVRFFNTTVTRGDFAPAAVRGTVRARAWPFSGGGSGQTGGAERVWKEVYGVQVATPFIENNFLDCRALQGYEGSGGPGDSSWYAQVYNDNDDL